MAGFGSGFAHALTAGLTGYQQGEDEQRKQLIILAAQRRQEERQKQQDEIARIGALASAANAGLDVGPAGSAPPPPAVVPDTASVRAQKGQNPTSPEGGQPAPAIPSQDGSVLGTINGMQIRVPQGGVIGKAARDDAAKQAQRTADLLKRAQPLNAKLPAGHPYKLSDDQLASVAADPDMYNQWAKGALGITRDPQADHRANRLFDVAHPTRDTGPKQEPLVQIADPDNPTGPAIYVPRSQAVGKHAAPHAGNARSTAMIQKAVAENQTQVSIIDDALAELDKHESAVGSGRVLGDFVNQRIDKKGVDARAQIANVGSLIVHDRSGAAVTVSEYPRLAPFVPKITDTPYTIRHKLAKLKAAIQVETGALQTTPQSAQSAAGSPTTPTPGDPGGDVTLGAPKAGTRHDVTSLKAKYGLE